MTGNTVEQRLRQGIPWVVASRLGGAGLVLMANVVVARTLGPDQFGASALFTSFVALASMFAMVGFDQASVRLNSEYLACQRPDLIVHLYRSSLSLVTLVGLGVVVVSVVGLGVYDAGLTEFVGMPVLAPLLAVGILGLTLVQVAAESLRGLHRLGLASLFSGGQTGGPISVVLFLAVFLVSLLFTRPTLAMALSAQVAAIALVCLAAVVLLGQTVRRFGGAPEASFPKGEVPSTAGLVGLGLPLMLVQLLAFVIQQGDLWMVQWSCTLQEVGLYNAARRLLLVAAMPVQISMFSVLSTIPDLAARGKLVELERVLRSASTLTAVVALPVLVLLLLVPGAALTLLFGDSYGEAVGPLIVLSLGYVVMVLLGNPIHVLTMTGRHRAALAINLGCGIALVVGAILAGRYCGLLGIAAAVSTSLTFQSAAAWWTVRCQIGVRTHVGWMARN